MYSANITHLLLYDQLKLSVLDFVSQLFYKAMRQNREWKAWV